MEKLAEGDREPPVYLGVDTHSETHVCVALEGAGRRLGELVFPNSETGYAEVLRWALGFGAPVAAVVEGTGSYGAGLSRYLRTKGVSVWEVNRTSRQHRRRYGKHGAADAEAAARAVIAGTASGEPKGADGPRSPCAPCAWRGARR
jgi:transposase